jgi:glycosyltransferase involved in cell wall biosynthesis
VPSQLVYGSRPMKRVCFVSTSAPIAGSGTGERTLSILNAVARVAETHFLVLHTGGPAPIAPVGSDWSTVRLFEPGQDTRWYWRKRKYLLKDFRTDRRLANEIRRLHAKHRFDAFLCRYFSSAQMGCDQFGPTVLDFDDLPSRIAGPRVPGWDRLGWQLTMRRLRSFRTVLVTKQSDKERIHHPDVRVLPCISTRIPESRSSSASEHLSHLEHSHRLLFVGSMRWQPNREGLMTFIHDVLPEIRRQIPGAILRVVGEDSDRLGQIEGVSGAGFVGDLAVEYRQASVVICPVYGGSGANVKLAEAAQFGKAVVTTPAAAEGFRGILQPGQDICVAESNQSMSEMCVHLLTNATARDKMGQRAMLTAQERLSQRAVDQIIEDILANCWDW